MKIKAGKPYRASAPESAIVDAPGKERDRKSAGAVAPGAKGLDAPRSVKIGARVRYRFLHRDTGTVVKSARGSLGNWYVRWDHDPHGPRLLQTWEQNLEVLPEEGPRPDDRGIVKPPLKPAVSRATAGGER